MSKKGVQSKLIPKISSPPLFSLETVKKVSMGIYVSLKEQVCTIIGFNNSNNHMSVILIRDASFATLWLRYHQAYQLI